MTKDPTGYILKVPQRDFPVPIINSKKYRYSDAIFVVETTPKSLRKWLQNPEVALVFSGEEEGWREFNFADLVVLATMRKLVDFGVGVGGASDFANTIIMSHALGLFTSGNASPSAMAHAFEGVRAVLYQVEGQADVPWRCRIDTAGVDRGPPAATYLTLHMEDITKRALARLIEIDPSAAIEHGAPGPIVSVGGQDTPSKKNPKVMPKRKKAPAGNSQRRSRRGGDA